MKISILKNTIILNEIEKLKRYHISQLEYYGFKKENGNLLKQSEDCRIDLNKIINYFKEENLSFTLTENASTLIKESQKKNDDFNQSISIARELKEGVIDYGAFQEFKSFLNSLPRKLKPHQLKAAYHFYNLKNGANFSVPGSGKTSVVLSVYEKLKFENKCNTLFIIGPPSCFQPWKNEFLATLGREAKSIILSGGNKHFRKSEYYKTTRDTYEIYFCTFQTALNDHIEIAKFLSQNGLHTFLVIDEAHYMKQIGGSWASSLLHIGKYALYKGVLTGTPIPKSYKDIFNLIDFLWGDQTPLTEDDRIQIGLWEKKKKDEEVKALLNKRIGPLFYRVRKKDLGLRDAIFHEPICIKMNPNEKIIYDFIKAKIFDLAEGDYFQNEEVLNLLWKGRIMRLRQAVSHPKLLLSAIDGYSEKLIEDSDLKEKIQTYDKLEIPGKLEALSEIVLKLRNENQKILIWSNFIGTLEHIKDHFLSLGENCELIYGKTPVRRDDNIEIGEEKTREDIRDEFVDINSGLDILIANPAACAESISLHKTCFHAIYYDLSYNCAQYLQSLDRIHRVGGSELNEANYYFLQYENSLDQDIKINLDNKAQKMYNIIEQDYEIYDLDLYDESDDDIAAYKRLFN